MNYAGEGFLIPGNTKAYYKADSTDSWEYAWIHVDVPKAKDFFPKAGLSKKIQYIHPHLIPWKYLIIVIEKYTVLERFMRFLIL